MARESFEERIGVRVEGEATRDDFGADLGVTRGSDVDGEAETVEQLGA